MPLTPPPPAKPANETEHVPEFLHRTNLHLFKVKAVGFSAATVGAVVVWLALGKRLPAKLGIVLVGYLGSQALKNIKLWREWQQANPHKEKMHPDREREIQQESVKSLADAAKSGAWLTRGLVACIAVPSAIEVIVGLDRSVEVASVEEHAIRAGEWWRLLGGTYLHGGLAHFLGNMSALLVFGSILEVKGGRMRLPLVYLLSALGGSLATISLPPDVPSIGASGGIVGIIAYLFVLSGRQSFRFPPAFHGATVSVLTGLVTLGILGFWFIDNAGHAGGAVAGFLLAAIVVESARNFGEDVPEPGVDFLGWIAVAILAAGAAITSMALLGIHR